jgi:mannose-1-phosphate guanylyltransferase
MTAGILLVGGFGTRLKPLTDEMPKPMLPIAGIPVTEHQILAAKKAGITTVVLATSYLSEIFTPYFGDGSKWGMKLLYAVEKEPLGTGGAIRNAAELLESDENVVIFNGDVLSHHDIAAQVKFHEDKSADVTLHLISVEDARAFGCVPTDADGRVTAFLEKMDKPVTNSINAGCYVFNRSVINQIPLGKVVSVERETFPALVTSGRPVFGYKEQAYWLDVGTPAALFKGSRDAVGADFKVGQGTTIGDGCKISGGSSIGSRCQIGQGVTIFDSVICDDVRIESGASISRSFIAPGATVDAGADISSHYLSKKAFSPINLQ